MWGIQSNSSNIEIEQFKFSMFIPVIKTLLFAGNQLDFLKIQWGSNSCPLEMQDVEEHGESNGFWCLDESFYWFLDKDVTHSSALKK